jgi:hypothetical protein
MSLRIAILHYTICLVIFSLVCMVPKPFPNLAFFFYPGIGIYLSRKVLKELIEWHPMNDTLSNVTNAKLSTVIFWPISYVILFMQLGINKIL